jgi:hypothetical protein
LVFAESPLGRAVELKKAEIVSVLMKYGAKPNRPGFGSPLDIDILNSNKNIVGILLTGISHLGGATGTEALRLALDRGKLGIVQQLAISNKSQFLSLLPSRMMLPCSNSFAKQATDLLSTTAPPLWLRLLTGPL